MQGGTQVPSAPLRISLARRWRIGLCSQTTPGLMLHQPKLLSAGRLCEGDPRRSAACNSPVPYATLTALVTFQTSFSSMAFDACHRAQSHAEDTYATVARPHSHELTHGPFGPLRVSSSLLSGCPTARGCVQGHNPQTRIRLDAFGSLTFPADGVHLSTPTAVAGLLHVVSQGAGPHASACLPA
jgi:hypothetical protein